MKPRGFFKLIPILAVMGGIAGVIGLVLYFVQNGWADDSTAFSKEELYQQAITEADTPPDGLGTDVDAKGWMINSIGYVDAYEPIVTMTKHAEDVREYSIRYEVQVDLVRKVAQVSGVRSAHRTSRYSIVVARGGAFGWVEVEPTVLEVLKSGESEEDTKLIFTDDDGADDDLSLFQKILKERSHICLNYGYTMAEIGVSREEAHEKMAKILEDDPIGGTKQSVK